MDVDGACKDEDDCKFERGGNDADERDRVRCLTHNNNSIHYYVMPKGL